MLLYSSARDVIVHTLHGLCLDIQHIDSFNWGKNSERTEHDSIYSVLF